MTSDERRGGVEVGDEKRRGEKGTTGSGKNEESMRGKNEEEGGEREEEE